MSDAAFDTLKAADALAEAAAGRAAAVVTRART